ncbi:hypothetical protein [Streptacidiphilus sp. PAMC 29251]
MRATDIHRSLERDHALARAASWTRATAVAAVVACAALGAGFAHVLPGHTAAQTGTGSGTSPRTQPAPAQPPAPGQGPGQVTSGAS